MFFSGESTAKVIKHLKNNGGMDFIDFLQKEITKFKTSQKRLDMLVGEKYYDGLHDIINRKRTIIGKGGELTEVDNLPNNIIIDNQYARMVDQKNNYLLSKEITFDSDDEIFLKCVKNVFNYKFMKTLKGIGLDCINCGIAYLYIYYDDFGKLDFKRFAPFEILPFWKDAEHSILDFAVRIYEVETYINGNEKIVEKAEVYLKNGIKRFFIEGCRLIPDNNGEIIPYIVCGNRSFDFGKVPIVAFRQNDKELPLILKVKPLQDALNTIHSDFINNLQEDARNTILVLKNYDGTNLGEFRKNLAKFGAVKVKSVDGSDGGVSTLKIDVDSNNFKTVIQMLKNAILENARGVDSKSDKMSSQLSKMNIQSIYSDIDLDANSMESEFKASFSNLLFFIKFYIKNYGFGNFDFSDIKIIFNRDILINETEVIDNCIKSLQILSRDSVISQHPWTNDVLSEKNKLMKEGLLMLKKKLLEFGLNQQQSDEIIKLFNQSINQNKIKFAVENSLIKNKAKNIKAASALIDFDKLKSDENGIYGIDEQIQLLKNNEETAFLFDSDKPDDKFTGAKPEEGADRSKPKNFRKMTYTELCKFLK